MVAIFRIKVYLLKYLFAGWLEFEPKLGTICLFDEVFERLAIEFDVDPDDDEVDVKDIFLNLTFFAFLLLSFQLNNHEYISSHFKVHMNYQIGWGFEIHKRKKEMCWLMAKKWKPRFFFFKKITKKNA